VLASLVLAASALLLIRYGAAIPGWLVDIWALVAAVPPAYVLAACGLNAAEVTLNTSAWLTVLRTAHPGQEIPFRQALGVVQGGIGLVAVIPPKVGGVAVLGLYRTAFPTLGIAALIATRTVQGISASVLGLGVLLLFGASATGDPRTFLTRVVDFYAAQPILAVAATVLGAALVVLLARRGRARLRGFGRQLAQGGAILRTPGRYALLVAAPTALAFACRWGVTGVLMAAFSLPVNLDTLVRVNIAHGLARSVQITPGGIGTTTPFDLVALRGLASVDAIAAYSLAQAAILLAFNVAFAVSALVWAFGWQRAIALVSRSGRGSA
jgi:lysylphosphatidylglycerol synthase-like protein